MDKLHNELTDRTADLLALADVHRWSVVKTLRTQSVAEHSFNTAVIAMELLERLAPPHLVHVDWLDVLWWALVHDASETFTGDIDGRFKRLHADVLAAAIKEVESSLFPWYHNSRPGVDNPVYWIVKLADSVEALWFILTWGHGPRAEDVYRDNLVRLFEQLVPTAAGVIVVPQDELAIIVKHVLDHSTSESNSVQLRRFRGMTPKKYPKAGE